MFGLSKDVLLKRDILLYLEQQTKPISSQKIADDLNKVTIQTLLKVIKELAEQLDRCYDREEVRLEINRHYGVYLVRNGINFNRIFEKILSETINYYLLKQLVLYRTFSAEEFCKKYQISLSTLRRNINRVNHFLSAYQVVLKIGTKVTIVGKESQIRVLFFSFLRMTHCEISRVSWIDATEYLFLAKRVTLACSSEEQQNIEVLAMWLFVNLQAGKQNYALENNLSLETFDLILPASDILPQDWEYILTVAFVLSLLTIEPQWDFERLYESQEADLSRFSFDLFEKYFRKLTVQEKQKIAKQLYRHYLGKQLGVEQLLFTAIDQSVISAHHPLLNKKFEQLWQEWSAKAPELTSEALQQEYFHLCYRYADSETLFPIVRVKMQSSLPKETVNHIQLQISHYLKNSATVVFGAEPADFTMTTEENAQGIQINSVLSMKDLEYIRQHVLDCIKKQ